MVRNALQPASFTDLASRVFARPEAFTLPTKRAPFVLTRRVLSLWCAVKRRDLPVGGSPTRQLSLRPVAIGAVVEVTKTAEAFGVEGHVW